MKLVFLYFIFVFLYKNCDSLKILSVFPSVSPSHFILVKPLLIELAKRGHQITSISNFPLDKPVNNYNDINFKNDLFKIYYDHLSDKTMYNINKSPTGILNFFYLGEVMSESTLSDENMQKLLKSNETFDLIIMQAYLTEALYGIKSHFQAPMIIFSMLGPSLLSDMLSGNPTNYAYVPATLTPFTDRMTFFQRVLNTLVYLLFDLSSFFFYPVQNRILAKYFPNSPSLAEIRKDIDLIFLSSHNSIQYPRPLMPNTVEIGGLHIPPVQNLSNDLQDFLDSSENGVIYFSLGSNVKSRDMPKEMKQAIVKTLSQLNLNVLWKWEDDNFVDKPSNVKIGKWFPQTDILAHPKLKLFITHGGWGSLTEAISRGVPIIGIPVFGDQTTNINLAVQRGFGIRLDLANITYESFSWAIYEVLNNPSYNINMKKVSASFNDREIQPMDRAIYWVEYIARNKGAKHLQSASLNLNRLQLLLIDVILFIIFVITLVFLLFYIITRLIYRKFKKNYNFKLKNKKD